MGPSNFKNQEPDSQSPPNQIVGSDNLEFLGEASSSNQPEIHQKEPTKTLMPKGKITSRNVLALLDYQNYCCALTGRKLTPKEASLDHIVPVRDGGEHLIENVQVLHRDVNKAKSVLSNQVFIDMCKQVADFSANQYEF